MNEQARILDGRRIMVVEDDYLVALGLLTVLEEAGAHVVGPFASAQEAVALLEQGCEIIDAAVLDVDLNGAKSYPVAEALASRDIRFIFATGYGVDALAEGYRHYPRCQKPFDHNAILKALKG
ncbi:response regulator [Caballeronia sp. LZ025]|uniref:response regulator n=1 Tax=Caballeronia TaxID=1827195 RepID=UPI001FD35C23|nr:MULTISPECIES: response regulator [Caballeronia]MDR5735957.1 response regulator [Caballeronia sp. LZ025]